MLGGGNHVIIYNRMSAECGVLDNFRGLCGPRTRTCKLFLKYPQRQRLSSRIYSTDNIVNCFLQTLTHVNHVAKTPLEPTWCSGGPKGGPSGGPGEKVLFCHLCNAPYPITHLHRIYLQGHNSGLKSGVLIQEENVKMGRVSPPYPTRGMRNVGAERSPGRKRPSRCVH